MYKTLRKWMGQNGTQQEKHHQISRIGNSVDDNTTDSSVRKEETYFFLIILKVIGINLTNTKII